jgi:hypothetical protein
MMIITIRVSPGLVWLSCHSVTSRRCCLFTMLTGNNLPSALPYPPLNPPLVRVDFFTPFQLVYPILSLASPIDVTSEDGVLEVHVPSVQTQAIQIVQVSAW